MRQTRGETSCILRQLTANRKSTRGLPDDEVTGTSPKEIAFFNRQEEGHVSIAHPLILGRLASSNSEATEPAKVTHQVQGLLAYLLLHRHRSHFTARCWPELFWGDHPQNSRAAR